MRWQLPTLIMLAVLLTAPAAHASVLDTLLGWVSSEVTTKGLSIRWNGELTAAEVQLRDAKGTYATLDTVAIHWSPLALIHGRIEVSLITVASGDIARIPESSSSSSSSSRTIDVAKLDIGRLTLEPEVARTTATLAVQASYHAAKDTQGGTLQAQAIGAQGTYTADTTITASSVQANVTANEAPGGMIARAAGLPDVGAITVNADVDGPRDAIATKLAIAAGQLHAGADGTLDLTHEAANLTVTAKAPAMKPAPDLAWASVDVQAHLSGPFSAPQLDATGQIADLSASTVSARLISLAANGDRGAVKLTGQVDGLVIPGKQPDLFAAAPVLVTADATLNTPERPVTFTVRHPLLTLTGTADTGTQQSLQARLELPALEPLAGAAGQQAQGALEATVMASRSDATTTASLDATVGITGGVPPVPAVVGPDARLHVAGNLTGDTVTVTSFRFDGQDATLSANGTLSPQSVSFDWTAGVARLEPIDPRLGGTVQAKGEVRGATNHLALTSDISGDVALQGQHSGPFTAHLQAQGLPHQPSATLTAQGALLSAPIRLDAAGAKQPDGTLHLTISQASWKSLKAQGTLNLPQGQTIPLGQIQLTIGRLADFAPLVGKPLSGSVQASLNSNPNQAVMRARLADAGMAGTASLSQANLSATITDLATHPTVDGQLKVAGVKSGRISGSAEITAKGPENALAMQVAAQSPSLAGAPARLNTAGVVDVPGKSVALNTLSATWKGQDVRLLQPVTIGLAQGVDIHALRLALGQAIIEVNGAIGPTLDLTASARNVPLSLAQLVSPSLNASGTISADARLTGTAAAPTGTVRASASGVALNTPSTHGLPPASLTAMATLQGTSAQIDARAIAGGSTLSLTGQAPLRLTGPMNLRASGNLDLAMANGMFAHKGEGLSGRVTLAADVTGTPANPGGTIRADGTGVRLLSETGRALPPAAIHAVATLQGDTARLDTRVSAASSVLTVSGTAPLKSTGQMDLRADGTVALTLLNPLIEAGGQRVNGTVQIASTVGGTLSAPAVNGTVRLTGGDFRDYVEGVHLSDIAAVIAGTGSELRVESLRATAGNGTLSGSGTIGVMAPGIPLDLHLVANNATPLAGGQVTATVNADLRITGEAESRATLGGTIFVSQAVIRVPDKLPTSVVTIPVRIAGQPPPEPAQSSLNPVIGLDMTIRAPQQIFVRGRGLNAELGGTVTIQGTTSNMVPRGVLSLRRGTFNLVGNTLTFNSGDIAFNGGSLTNPALDLVAMSTVNRTVATLTVGGTARDPKITLSSQPELPQDQILALLLFHTNTGQLSPFQIASIAAGLAEISGSTSSLPNPLESLQNALGLDQLGINSGPNGSPTLQAGRYVGRNLYVGAQESTGGTGAQGVVTYNLTPGLKLNATVGAGQTTSAIGNTGETNGASVGLSYQFQY